MQNAQNAAAKIASARASIARDTGTLESMKKQLDVIKAQTAQARAALTHEQAAEHQAELNLSYTTIVAPSTDGRQSHASRRPVCPGRHAAHVGCPDQRGLCGRELQGDAADRCEARPARDIEVDMFPGRVFHGHVDSLAPASGQKFALLPPDNATGNFTKVVQRIPVKIMLDPEAGARAIFGRACRSNPVSTPSRDPSKRRAERMIMAFSGPH